MASHQKVGVGLDCLILTQETKLKLPPASAEEEVELEVVSPPTVEKGNQVSSA